MRATFFAIGAAGALLAAPALATPPAGALPLSEVLRVLETGGDLAHVEEVEWDDEGFWAIEYRNAAGAEVEVRMDPITGLPRE